MFSIAFFNGLGFQHSVTQKRMDFRLFFCEFRYGSDLSSLSLRKVILAQDGRKSERYLKLGNGLPLGSSYCTIPGITVHILFHVNCASRIVQLGATDCCSQVQGLDFNFPKGKISEPFSKTSF